MNKVSQSIAVLVLAVTFSAPGWAQDRPAFPRPTTAAAQSTFWPAQPAAPAKDMQPTTWFPPSGTVVDSPAGTDCAYPDTAEICPSRCLTMQILGGFYFSPLGGANDDHPRFHYAPTIIRLGGLLDSPIGPGGSCGRLEPLLEIQGSYVFTGPGRWFYGPSGLLRYNFAAPDWRIIPYIQGGAGVAFSSDNDLIRSSGELIVQGGFGCRWWARPSWSIDLEVQYNRITGRGDGVDALGGSLGVTHYFPWFSR